MILSLIVSLRRNGRIWQSETIHLSEQVQTHDSKLYLWKCLHKIFLIQIKKRSDFWYVLEAYQFLSYDWTHNHIIVNNDFSSRHRFLNEAQIYYPISGDNTKQNMVIIRVNIGWKISAITLL